MLQNKLKELIKQDAYRMEALRAASELKLPDWYLAAGFVRNLVWDNLHGYAERTPLSDLDLIYMNSQDITKEIEAQYEATLQANAPGFPWSVKNQARMHLAKGDTPYLSVHDAMARWPETATAVGVRLEADDSLTILAPYGLSDLFGLIVQQSPKCLQRTIFTGRIEGKRWLQIWPKLAVIDEHS